MVTVSVPATVVGAPSGAVNPVLLIVTLLKFAAVPPVNVPVAATREVTSEVPAVKVPFCVQSVPVVPESVIVELLPTIVPPVPMTTCPVVIAKFEPLVFSIAEALPPVA